MGKTKIERDRTRPRGPQPYLNASVASPGVARLQTAHTMQLADAAAAGDIQRVGSLIGLGADPNLHHSMTGRSPLHAATISGHVDIVRYLLDNGAELDCRTSRGWTVLHQSAAHGHISIVQLLLERGASVTWRTSVGHTPLHTAARSGHVEIARILIEKGADIRACTYSGWLPLHHAAKEGFMEMVVLLLEKCGADKRVLQAKTNKGWTAMEHATNKGHQELGNLLLRAGAADEIDGGAAEKSDLDALIDGFKF